MNLELNYGLQFPDINLSVNVSITLLPTPSFSGSVDLGIAHFGMQIDNGTNGTEDTTPGHGVNGFLELYEHDSVSDLQPDAQGDPGFPAPGGDQFVPQLTFMMKDFTLFQFGIDAGVQLFPDFLSPEVNLNPDPPVLHGQFVIDYWLNQGLDYTTGDINLGPFGDYDFGLQILPSYQYNAPIFVVPFESLGVSILHDEVFTFTGFGDFSDHFDPFSGMMLASAVGDDASASALLTDSSLLPAFDAATSLWLAAGIDPSRLEAALDGAGRDHRPPGPAFGADRPDHPHHLDRPGCRRLRLGHRPEPGGCPRGRRMAPATVVTHEVGHLLGYNDGGDGSMELCCSRANGRPRYCKRGPPRARRRHRRPPGWAAAARSRRAAARPSRSSRRLAARLGSLAPASDRLGRDARPAAGRAAGPPGLERSAQGRHPRRGLCPIRGRSGWQLPRTSLAPTQVLGLAELTRPTTVPSILPPSPRTRRMPFGRENREGCNGSDVARRRSEWV